MKKGLVSILIVLTILNCKDSSSENMPKNDTNVESKSIAEVPKKQLIFEVELETSKPDDFTLFCNEIFLNNNQFMNIRIKHKLAANETKKTIKFTFPEGIIPDYNLGFLLGTKLEKVVDIKKVFISFGDNQLNIPNADLHKYFIFNKFVEYKETEGLLEVKKIDGKLNPFISLKRKYLDELIK